MAHSFIGKPISLISHSDVRYRGILAGIDPQASTIQLSNVYSMGTESRRPAGQYIPPMAEPYQYIIFKASEVKDLSVDEPIAAAQRNVHDDPAVMRLQTTYSLGLPVQPVRLVADLVTPPTGEDRSLGWASICDSANSSSSRAVIPEFFVFPFLTREGVLDSYLAQLHLLFPDFRS
ncbi:hypothetical protein NMY22_g13805 [Coprinellus aureogranulatus]|nr:hypothetical protein NMY22_g13805 [Coprinellus aureogranulatus]